MGHTSANRPLYGLSLGAGLLVLGGCQAADSAAAADGGGEISEITAASGAVPAIRARLKLEMLHDGRNAAQDAYRKTVAICEEAGVPVKPLGPEQVSRLDTGIVEVLRDAKRRLSRETTWGWSSPPGPESLCQFRLEERVAERYMDATVTGWTGGPSDPGWHESPAEDGAMQVYPVDVAEEQRLAQATGWKLEGASSRAGEACTRWTSARETACMWSGGTEIGISSAPPGYVDCFTASFDRFEAAIPLQVEPTDGNGCRITMQSMNVGKGTLPANDVIPLTKARTG